LVRNLAEPSNIIGKQSRFNFGEVGMRVCVLGSGYVGIVSSACLARDGFEVVAVDPSETKVAAINAGMTPIVEPGLSMLLKDQVEQGNLIAQSAIGSAIADCEMSLVCVGTPSRMNGSLDTKYVAEVANQIGTALRDAKRFHSVVFRSTMLPGTMDDLVIPILERCSGMSAGEDFGVAYYPEFLREGTALQDYDSPGAVVFGVNAEDHVTLERLHRINKNNKASHVVVPIRTAEAAKYTNNCWHAVKISFANEIGNICKQSGIDSHVVMDILCSDTRLNISRAYLKPGFAYGGSCLPKDLRALRYHAKSLDVPTPVLESALTSNSMQIDRAFNMITSTEARRIGLIGLTFKSDTDDLRESPMVELAERLLGKGYSLLIHDPSLRSGSNTAIANGIAIQSIPHLEPFITTTVDEVVMNSDVVVLGKSDETSREAHRMANGHHTVFDLARIDANLSSKGSYHGICW
jgi:GDP-mannose 6-dehydrogenase